MSSPTETGDETVRTVYGIDFSGAKDAGRKIWITVANPTESGLEVVDCFPAKDLPGSGVRLTDCLRALRNFIERKPDGAFGIDFPFGIPSDLADAATWEDFVLAFPERYPSPDDFQRELHKRTGGKEVRRWTDIRSRTPFSPYNLRIYRQTYHGLREILFPLVAGGGACILPMQDQSPGRALVVEICPRSTLATRHSPMPYKGGTRGREGRRQLLLLLERTNVFSYGREEVKPRLLSQGGGDAIDSLVAALAVSRYLRLGFQVDSDADWRVGIEGYVYA